MLKDLSFEDWLRHLFDHPVIYGGWHWNHDSDVAELPPLQIVDYASRLFQRAGELMAHYSDGQANQGLWYLINEGGPLCALGDVSIPIQLRVQCIASITLVFEQCFVPRCTPHLSHLNEPGLGELNAVCYMWWDAFPTWGEPINSERAKIDAACLSVMETTLELPSIACQESALHGLSHWGFAYEQRCQSVISAFLSKHKNLRPELREYALKAREQGVQ